MRTKIFFLLLFLSFGLYAQTGIGTTTPNASAKLDVYSTNKGFLPPRVTLTSATDAATITSPAEGLLVYSLGSVGLQAGYYYWNGANWATIATATSAGIGVTASDMAKIYDGVGNAATINVNGATFSVTTSGKYQIDFSASATCGNCNFTVNFQVRDGANSNAIIASDRQTSYSNNVHAEYNGKVEVNLQAGRSYNVLVTTTGGGIYDNDYVRVYLKQVSGNLPVTGQTVDYVSTSLSNSYSNVGSGYDIVLQQLNGGNIPYNTSTGVYTLAANKTYMLQAQLRANTASAGGAYLQYTWVDATTNTPLVSNSDALISSSTSTAGYGSKEVVQIIYTPTTNQTIKLRSTANSGTQSIVMGSAVITQIGSSAIINPWTLAGTNTYNTTGNVGIGTNSPNSTLDITGSLAVSGATNLKGSVNIGTGIGLEGGEIDLANAASGNTTLSGNVGIDVYGDKVRIFENGGNARGVNIDLSKAPIGASGDLMWKASGIVNRGVDITLGNLKARMASSGNASLQLSTVTGTYSVYGSGIYSQAGTVIGTTIDAASPMSISTTPTYLKSSYSFGTAGSTDNWVIMDTTNAIAWRITMILGAGVNNNLISIERLF